MLARIQRKENSLTFLVGMKTGTATLENSMELFQKVKNRTILWPSNCITGYLPKGYKNTDLKGHMHPNVYSSIINNSQIMKKAQTSINWWIDKKRCGMYTHTHRGILLSHKEEWNLAICNDMDGTRGYYGKWNKSIRERQLSYDLTDMWNIETKPRIIGEERKK